MPSSVYLSGSSNFENDNSIPIKTDWKVYATSKFIQSGIIVANPIDLDLTGFIETKNENVSESAVKHSLNLIDKADSLLANLIGKTEATSMELFYAHRQGKQVVVVGNEPFNPWVLTHSEVRFNKLKEALEYLVSQPSKLDTVSWAYQFESDLSKRSEVYPPAGELDFEYYGGTLPILVLAPHSASYFREGNFYSSESYTGTISVLLHKLTGCHSLITSYCTIADPLLYLNSPYVNFLSQILKKANIKFVISLHGIEEWNTPSDLVLSSFNKTSLIDKTEYLNLLLSMLKVKNFKNVGFDLKEFLNIPSKTLNHLIFEDFRIPVLRIDIHKRYRLPQMQPSLFTDLTTSLAQFLMLVR